MFPICTTLFPNPNNNNSSSSNFSFLTEHHHHHLAVSTCNIDQPHNYKSTYKNNKNSNKKKKKKRSLPGQPDPEAEVIALSPGTLLATNRFTCEICNRTFQREQNLQLHRRGHNLPWKLKRRGENNNKSSKKQVYVCPEETCVHHHPSRALGDLTGIKKHFCRKHGEKKWKCHKCSKLYAVHSDWKAHSKTCGTRHYTCDCGSVFSRKDSFVTHKGFCDALAQESARLLASAGGGERSSSQDLMMMMMMINSTSSSSNYSAHDQNPNPNYNYSSSTAAPAPSTFGYSNVAAPFHDRSHDLGTHHHHHDNQAGVNYKDYNYSSVVMIPSTTNDDHINHVADEVEEFMHGNFQGAAVNHHHVIMSRQDNESCLTRNFWV